MISDGRLWIFPPLCAILSRLKDRIRAARLKAGLAVTVG